LLVAVALKLHSLPLLNLGYVMLVAKVAKWFPDQKELPPA